MPVVPVKNRRDSTMFWLAFWAALSVPWYQLAPLPLASLAIGRPWPKTWRWSPSVVGLTKLRRWGDAPPAPPPPATSEPPTV
jgi:hypothetical protein